MNRKKEFKPIIHIYCDGETEINYLDAVRRDRYNGIQIEFKPKLKGTVEKTISDLEDDASKQLIQSHVVLFCALDMDTLRAQQKMPYYKSQKSKLLGIYNNICFLESMPCIEFWFLLHFKPHDRLITRCSDVVGLLDDKQLLPNYTKKEKFTKGVYTKLKPNTQNAIKRAKSICGKNRTANEEFSYSTMYSFFERMDAMLQ